ncbi:MAG TPA: sugar ABC transporter permease [bacterium]|nr:sugar ABC transporter permease [bacterium]
MKLLRKTKNSIIGYTFVSPSAIGLFVIICLPIFFSFYISFHKWTLLTPPTITGLDNFVELFGFHQDEQVARELKEAGRSWAVLKSIEANDPLFWKFLGNTFFYILAVPLVMVVSLIVALALNQRGLRGLVLFRTIFFLPVVTSIIAVGLLWRWMLNGEFGIVNVVLSWVGIRGPNWLGDTGWVKPAVILIRIWNRCGYYMIIYLAGLQGIPSTLYEAAEIDGANVWQKLRNITFPLLAPTHFFVMVMESISILRVFDLIFVLTPEGGPGGASTPLAYYLYVNAFRYFRMGYASAVAWALFLIIFSLTLLQWRLRKKWVYVEE